MARLLALRAAEPSNVWTALGFRVHRSRVRLDAALELELDAFPSAVKTERIMSRVLPSLDYWLSM